MKKNIIKINNLYKVVKKDTILNNINLEIQAGQIYGFVGHNGSGKSMLFKSICGLIRPSSGEIVVNDKIVGKDINFPENIGVLIETPGFIPQYTGFKNLKLLSLIKNKITDEDIKNNMNLVNLDPNNKRSVKKYSLGMKQRLGIAQAIMENPDILILDEPMNGLDYEGVEEVRNLINQFKSEGKTILLTSHNKEDIDLLCDKVFRLNKGSLEEFSTSQKTEGINV